MKINRKIFLLSVLLCSFSLFLFAEETNVQNLFRETLDNGLQVFVMENNSAPLAHIEIAIRGGGVTQTPETAGLFHLYEHLMFKGNSKYPNQESFTEAMNKLGVGNWNGSTGVDKVNYYFTIPSSVVREGMEFWSYAVRSPKIDKEELEREKGVVLSEINGKFTQPGMIRGYAFNKAIFNKAPYRVDPSGNPKSIEKATVEQMKKIQSEFYVPENTAIFVGGDVKHEDIFKFAKQIFGNWKKSPNPVSVPLPPSKEISSEIVKLVYADPSSSDEFISATYALRGPDGEIDQIDTYPADVWGNLVDNPNGIFAKTFIENKILSIPDSDYVGASYYTQRASGKISFSAYMVNDGNPVKKSDEFLRVIQNDLLQKMLDEKSGFTSEIKNAEKKLADSRIYEMETATGILSNLSFCFSSCDSEYFFNYDEKIASVTENDVRNFIKKYISDKKGVLLVNVSPSVFEKYKEDFKNSNFSVVTEKNAYWWR